MSAGETLVEAYKRTHPTSKKLHERAVEVFTANGATHVARIFDPFKPYITHAQGSRKWDVDGNEYIDYILGHGGLILGHRHPAVVQAVQEQMAKGVHYGANHQLEVEWAKLIKSMMPVAERVEFCACGQEANLMAIRLSRVFTGRRKIIRFEENFRRADILEALNPKTPKERRVRHSGTWNANPLLCSAGIAACKLYLSGEPQRQAREAADYLREKGNQVIKQRNISGRLYSRSIVHIYFGPIDYEPPDDTMPPTKDPKKLMSPAMVPIQTRLCLHLLQRGVATQTGRYFALSAAHTKQDIDQTIDAFANSLDAMVGEGTLQG